MGTYPVKKLARFHACIILETIFQDLDRTSLQKVLKILMNGRESTANRMVDGSIYPS